MTGALRAIKRDAPTDARQVRSRNALADALLALLEEKPFDQLTIREITARAGTGYATFFRHYPTKEALLGDVASEEIAHLLAMTVPILDQVDSFQSTLALCAYVAEHGKLWSALLTGGAAGIVRAEFIRQARGLAQAVQMRRDWLPPDLGVVHGTGATIDVLAWWLDQAPDTPAEEIAAILHRLVIAPLVGDGMDKPVAAE
ncbi:TetR/AcrR family transcriptional regulator [Novosphingobium album (ex Liu et al. 2023)]|uniref:Helix-turn-helix domain containing protein n=1 Tax=Novosphingobium album (ex Liu et al. 2023) TaxID=3031130 RepID=A0ABT5WLM2_9SPHN|nr:TetR/AcrR family transcriptional regulator [Novosphingobium album (ex Liu et al. 2023)]MDE8650935.1 helix-turn-helix domain containing protein [Novosphingobium album (ex Liu et al. 2023)]